jgi:hypothetical protein
MSNRLTSWHGKPPNPSVPPDKFRDAPQLATDSQSRPKETIQTLQPSPLLETTHVLKGIGQLGCAALPAAEDAD